MTQTYMDKFHHIKSCTQVRSLIARTYKSDNLTKKKISDVLVNFYSCTSQKILLQYFLVFISSYFFKKSYVTVFVNLFNAATESRS